ncbi:MAG: MucR family transcriptional regulator [Alphaproteobacteria bacterium]|nr:MucR family transcriptional regulator [Alphaproteobacteria bacterium]
MSDDTSSVDITARLVAAYASNNRLMPQDLPTLIQAVHSALLSLSNGGHESTGEPPRPAVSIKKSVTGDYIVCLEDGLKFKSLKRHLRSSYKMTPEEYRAKWGLPHDYPMVAPNYAAHRSRLAKQIGLGRKRPARRK